MKNLNVNYEIVKSPVVCIKDDSTDMNVFYKDLNADFLISIMKNEKNLLSIIKKTLKENNFNINDEDGDCAEYIIENNFINFLCEDYSNITIPMNCACETDDRNIITVTVYDDSYGIELFNIELDDTIINNFSI